MRAQPCRRGQVRLSLALRTCRTDSRSGGPARFCGDFSLPKRVFAHTFAPVIKPDFMTSPAVLRTRAVVGFLLAIAPAFPIFQTGRHSTLRGAVVTIAATVVALLLAWWTRPDPQFGPGWLRVVLIGMVGGLSASVFVAYAMGSEPWTILRFSWIPLLRAVAVSVGVCLMLSTLAQPLPALPADGETGPPTQPQPRTS